MTQVVDASALVAALTGTGVQARWARREIAKGSLSCPEVTLAEASNTLRRLEQAGHLGRGQATSAHQDLLDLDTTLYSFRPFAERVWELRGNLTSYDAWYVALAEALACPLVTLDLRLSHTPGPTCAFLTPPGEDE